MVISSIFLETIFFRLSCNLIGLQTNKYMTGFKIREPKKGHPYLILWKNYWHYTSLTICKCDISLEAQKVVVSENTMVNGGKTLSFRCKIEISSKKWGNFAKANWEIEFLLPLTITYLCQIWQLMENIATRPATYCKPIEN